MSRSFRVIVVGPTGAGKSQFCNFVQRDISNSINKVSDSLNSCTKDPYPNYFTRQNSSYEFIDTAGSSDSANDDVKNLENLVNYLKDKKSIDYIILVLKFNERVTKETREYINILGKIFTPGEFYTHLCVLFTKFPINPSKKDNKIKNKSIEEINVILKETFNINKNMRIPEVNVYFIDTECDEDDHTYEEKYQDTVDIMLKQMKLDIEIYPSINTTNFDMTGVNAKTRAQKQIEQLNQKLKEETKRREEEERQKKRLEEEIKKNKKNDKERRIKENQLKELMRKQEEERKRLEEFERENERKRRLIEEEARKKGIEISKLDDIIDGCAEFVGITGLGVGACFLLSLGGVALSAICPVAGPAIAGFFFYTSGWLTIDAVGAGLVAGGAKIAKEIKK